MTNYKLTYTYIVKTKTKTKQILLVYSFEYTWSCSLISYAMQLICSDHLTRNLNMDGSSFENSGCVGFGGFIRNDIGE
jgi:hypothetical protein